MHLFLTARLIAYTSPMIVLMLIGILHVKEEEKIWEFMTSKRKPLNRFLRGTLTNVSPHLCGWKKFSFSSSRRIIYYFSLNCAFGFSTSIMSKAVLLASMNVHFTVTWIQISFNYIYPG